MADNNGIPDALYIDPETGTPVQVNRPFGELTASPSPSPTQWIGNKLQDILEAAGAAPHVARHLTEGLSGMASLTPLGVAGSAADALAARAHGDDLGTVQAMAGMLPGASPVGREIASELAPVAGKLRNKFTGAFKRADAGTDLPANPYKYVATKTQAQPVAANSAEAQARYGFPGEQAAIDPALLEANLARLENPIAQQVAPRPAPVDPRTANLSKLPNGFTFGETEKHILKNYGLAGLSMLPPATAAFLSQRLTPVDFDPFSGT